MGILKIETRAIGGYRVCFGEEEIEMVVKAKDYQKMESLCVDGDGGGGGQIVKCKILCFMSVVDCGHCKSISWLYFVCVSAHFFPCPNAIACKMYVFVSFLFSLSLSLSRTLSFNL